MARSLNKVQLIGNIGTELEIRHFQNGGKVISFRLATSEKWRDRASGEEREATEWHTVSIYAENHIKRAEGLLRNGSKIYVEGKLETRKWQDKGGADRFSTEVVIRPYCGDFILLDAPQARTARTEREQGYHDDGGQYAPDSGQEQNRTRSNELARSNSSGANGNQTHQQSNGRRQGNYEHRPY